MADNIITKCNTLKRYWMKRNTKFKEWYELLELVDKLEQTNMESFVGNDPRAAFNLVLSMLDQKIPHRLPPETLAVEQTTPAAELSDIFGMAWQDVFDNYRRRGRYWFRDFLGYLLALGWYSVFATITADGSRCIAEIWHPATVFPSWDDNLIECAHIFPINEVAAKRMAARSGWKVTNIKKGTSTVYDYWWLDGERVFNSIALNRDVVKDVTYEPRFRRIPIFVSPVGGLPDTGELAVQGGADKWKEEIGQSVLATNEKIYNYWNKWWTFSMQLLRDTAQARTYEKSRSGTRIVKPEDWDKRGAHFRMSPEDEIGFIAPPPIPVELRASQLDMEAMMQRGGPSWAMFGAITQQMSAYVMSQIASSANQIAKPYHQGAIDCISDIDNFWFNMIKENKYKPYGKGLPAKLPPDAKITADYEIRIPGDLVQRATTARMLNPDFELSEEKVMEELFPEIKNPVEELARVRAGDARRHPVHAQITLIESFREEARLLREAKDHRGAELYERAASMVEASMGIGEEAPPAPPARRRALGVRPEVVPPPAPRAPIVGGE